MKIQNYKEEITIPNDVKVNMNGFIVEIKGPKGEVKKELRSVRVKLSVENNKIVISTPMMTKNEKKEIYTFKAHLKNMIKGCIEGFNYKMKICSGHFPMNVAVNKDEFVIKNFLGEKIPRILKIKKGAKVKIDGDIVTIESCSKETAGQVAADIEILTHIKGRDNRIFQDGIYIIDKAGKEIE